MVGVTCIRVAMRNERQQSSPARQRAILDGCWARLAPGGRLLYATCSLLAAENDGVVGPFLAGRDDARECTPPVPGAERTAHGWQLLPSVGGCDGLYYALLRKAPRSP